MEIEYNLTVSDVEQHAEALVDFHEQFVDFFRTTTPSGCVWSGTRGKLGRRCGRSSGRRKRRWLRWAKTPDIGL